VRETWLLGNFQEGGKKRECNDGLWQQSINSHIILLLMKGAKSAGLFLPAKIQMIAW
jgi:hypothetical protein